VQKISGTASPHYQSIMARLCRAIIDWVRTALLEIENKTQYGFLNKEMATPFLYLVAIPAMIG